MARLDARRVRQAMTSLSVNQRQAVVLKYVDGRTLKEISDRAVAFPWARQDPDPGRADPAPRQRPARPQLLGLSATNNRTWRYRYSAGIQTRIAPSSRLPQAK